MVNKGNHPQQIYYIYVYMAITWRMKTITPSRDVAGPERCGEGPLVHQGVLGQVHCSDWSEMVRTS